MLNTAKVDYINVTIKRSYTHFSGVFSAVTTLISCGIPQNAPDRLHFLFKSPENPSFAGTPQ